MNPRPKPLSDAAPGRSGTGILHTFLALGFRPFFLLAGVMALLWVPLWLCILSGAIPPPPLLGAVGWHRHEMIFGYTLAVVAGFLLTAAGNWTGRPMPSGWSLLLLALLWLAARAGLLAAQGSWAVAVSILDTLFPLAVAAALVPALWSARNYRNLGFVPLLAAIAGANAIVHLEAHGAIASGGTEATRFALNLIVLIIVVMGGRVIPFFTGNALPQAGVRGIAGADRAAVGLVAAMLLGDLLPLGAGFQGTVALAAAAANAWRMAGWRSFATRHHPILWILHSAYLWIVAGLALKGIANWTSSVPATLAIHALTVGGIGGLTLGMMSRVALGHTGRPIVAPRPIVAAYHLINCAAIVRVILPLVAPDAIFPILEAAGILWTGAFALFTWVYVPILSGPHATGRPA
jgi:uncharacterized protein involved in response to NO